jgi:HK97 family phage portal protein
LLGTIVDKAPVPLVSRSAALTGGRHAYAPRGQQAQLRAYGSNGTLFGIVNRTSTATAAVNWRLWRKAKSGKKEDRTEVTSHACIDLWNKPNEFFTNRLFVETEQQHVDLTGEGWIVIAKSPQMKNLPLELWPVPPHRMRPAVSPTDYLLGYIYTSPDGEEVPLGKEDVIQMRMPDPDNIYRGLGPVQALMRTLDSQRYSEEWNRNFFVNGAEPGGIIEVEERLGDDEFNEFRDRWAEAHQGIDNAHRVAILENKMKWVDRKYTMRDMQFVELAEVGDNKLFVAYGVSKSMLGVTENVNRSNAESGKVMFAEYLTIPRLDRIKDMLNFQLLPKYGPTAEGLEWDYDDPVPPDAEARDRERESKANATAAYVSAGFTGESLIKPLGLPEGMVWEKPEPPAPAFGAGQPGGGKPATKPAAPAPKPKSVLELSWLNAAPAPEPVQVDDPELQQVQDDWEKALAALLIVWAGISAAQQAELLAQITAAIAAGTVVALAALVVSTAAAATVLSAAMAAMASTAAKQMVKEAADQGKKLPVPKAFPGLKPVAETVAELLGQGLAQAAGREAVRVYAPGVAPEQVAEQVGEHLAGLSDAYLREQLGAAMTRAQNVGRLETVKDVPQTIYASSEVLDRATCKPCKDINGTVFDTWLDAWKAYAGGPYHACLGRNRCRGTVKATWNEAAG